MGSTKGRRGKESSEKQQTQSPVAGSAKEEERCPQCPELRDENAEKITGKEQWIRCDACKTWFHWQCVTEGNDIEQIDKW